MNNTWKQPIPVGLDQEFNNDYAAVTMYMMLIYRASNDTRIIRIPYATRETAVTIKRGQCLFSRRQFALYLGWSEKKCERVLKDLSDFYGKVTHERTSNITLVNLLNYESLISFDPRADSERTTKGQRADSEDTNLRVIKSDKTEKSEKKNTLYASTSDKLTVSSGKQTVVEHKQDTPLVKEEKEKYASIPLLIHAMFCNVCEKVDDNQYIISSYKTTAKEMKHHLAGRGDITIPAMYYILTRYGMPGTNYNHLFAWHKENEKRPRPEQILKWWIALKQEYVQYTPPPKEEFEQMFSEIGLKMRPEDYDKPY